VASTLVSSSLLTIFEFIILLLLIIKCHFNNLLFGYSNEVLTTFSPKSLEAQWWVGGSLQLSAVVGN
jgi:hypothetical protein